MTMTTIECEMFLYTKEEFERDIMVSLKVYSAKELKEIIDEQLEEKSKNFRTSVFKRILNQQNNKKWWIGNCLTNFEKTQEQEEFVAIWKMSIYSQRGFYLSCYEDKKLPEAIDSWFHNTLEEGETKLKEGKINEQQYINYCNNLKDGKERTQDLLNVCICSVIGRQNRARIGKSDGPIVDIFRITCMPCGFNG